jgi:hypothetical protein
MPKASARRLVVALWRAGFAKARIAGIAHLSQGYVEQLLVGCAKEVKCGVSHDVKRRKYWGQHLEDTSADYSVIPQ